MRIKTIAGLALSGAILFGGSTLLAACGAGGYGSSAAAPANAPAPETSAVDLGQTQLGAVLVDANGLTLYGFTDDANGTSTCDGSCAQNWPPLTVSPGWTAGSGTDSATFHTIVRDDGQTQLVAGEWPLYTFAGDSQPGDVNGQGSVGKWFAIAPDGTLLRNSSPASSPSSSAAAASDYGY